MLRTCGLIAMMLALVVACGDNEVGVPQDEDAGTLGEDGTGGMENTGGTETTGGVDVTGGTATTGGAQSTGGTEATGGAEATGGMEGTGGDEATGGTAGMTGGTENTGGMDATGGSKATGGTAELIDNGFPHDGELLATCFTDDDCTGDEMSCYQPQGSTVVGYCTESCPTGNDKTCSDIGDVQTTCGSGLSCRVDCSDDTGTDGNCPDKMECEPVLGSMRCVYPGDAGAVLPPWAVCDGELDTCSGEQVCPTQTLLGLPTPLALFGLTSGVCTDECTENDDCTDDGGLGGTASCISMGSLNQYCVIDCDNDKQCPGEMVCIEGGGPLTPKVCGYE